MDHVLFFLSGKTLGECIDACKAETLCEFWTHNRTEQSCLLAKIWKVENEIEGPDVLSGGRLCSGKSKPSLFYVVGTIDRVCLFSVFYPECAEINKNYTDAPLLAGPYVVGSVENCSNDCLSTSGCEGYLMETSDDWRMAMSCELHGDSASGTATDIVEADKTFVWADKTCVKTDKKIPALAEDAEELSYKEVCIGTELETMTRVNNTWDKEHCPSKT